MPDERERQGRWRWGAVFVSIAIASAMSTATARVALCPGDCDRSGAVTVDELVRSVAIALGESDPSLCAAADQDCEAGVTVDELLTSVGEALRGCAIQPRGEFRVAASLATGVLASSGSLIIGGTPVMPMQYDVTAADEVSVASYVDGLDTPWAIAFAADGRLFVSERAGRVRVAHAGALDAVPWASIDVAAEGEAGLMGLALHPEFPAVPYVYLCRTVATTRGRRENQLVRMRERDGRGVDLEVLLAGMPADDFHNGCRLKFGPDGKLYLSMGDGEDRERAQSLTQLSGKILRLEADGSPPAEHPFAEAPLVWSYGHRNPQGLAFDPVSGRLYATEHGPSFEIGIGAYDEVNVIEAGANYGWPRVIGAPGLGQYRDPLLTYPAPGSGPVPPAGAVVLSEGSVPEWRGDLLFASLGAQHLQRVGFDACGRVVAIERLFPRQFGRLRDVIEGPDGAVYVATSNRDGRGVPQATDDRILRLAARGSVAQPSVAETR